MYPYRNEKCRDIDLAKRAANKENRTPRYLRGPNNEDLSSCISKVVFQLHPSFTQPVREILEPPFEVTERGWGEFEAQIRIVWKDPSEKATIVSHIYAVGDSFL